MIENKKNYTKGFIAGIVFVILMDVFFRYTYEDGISFSESLILLPEFIWAVIFEYPLFSIAIVITIIAYLLVSEKITKFEK